MEIEIRMEYHKPTNYLCEFSYLNGIRNGVQKLWYDEGVIGNEFFYKNGLCHGIYKIFIYDGRLSEILSYKEGIRNRGIMINFKYR